MAKLRIDLMSEEMELKLYENCSYNYKKDTLIIPVSN